MIKSLEIHLSHDNHAVENLYTTEVKCNGKVDNSIYLLQPNAPKNEINNFT